MRPGRRPARAPLPTAPAFEPAPVAGIFPTSRLDPFRRAEDAGEVVRPFVVSGGQPFFGVPKADEVENGVQIVSVVYVPRGFVGFVKEITVAPYVDQLNAFSGSPLPWAYQMWQSPMGWETTTTPAGFRVRWHWQLRILGGKIEAKQAPIPQGIYLEPDVPYPQSVYGGPGALRLPGDAASQHWPPQRMQLIGPTAPGGAVHVPIPEDSTVILWAWWEQRTFNIDPDDKRDMILGPSFGALKGYLQKNARPDGQRSAREGWR